MIHLASEWRSSIGPLIALLGLWGMPVLLLQALVRIVTNLSTVIASIRVVAQSATLDWGIVGHSLTWYLVVGLMLLGALLFLVAERLRVLWTLLVRVLLGYWPLFHWFDGP
jgi:hypothetical protein